MSDLSIYLWKNILKSQGRIDRISIQKYVDYKKYDRDPLEDEKIISDKKKVDSVRNLIFEIRYIIISSAIPLIIAAYIIIDRI